MNDNLDISELGVSEKDKAFITCFTEKINDIGYNVSEIGKGYCWGKIMITYKRKQHKNSPMVARIYIRDDGIVLRFYLPGISKHKEYIENSKSYIKDIFVNDNGKCKHCKNDKNGKCNFRRVYIINDKFIEKCSGSTFQLEYPNIDLIDDYLDLFKEFYIKGRKQ